MDISELHLETHMKSELYLSFLIIATTLTLQHTGQKILTMWPEFVKLKFANCMSCWVVFKQTKKKAFSSGLCMSNNI